MRDFTVESNGRDCKHGRLARKCEICEMEAEIADAQRRINEIREDCDRRLMIRDAEIERLRADLVWAVRHGASEGYDGNSDPCIWYSGIERHRDVLCSRELSVDIDGTPDSICRAVREARDGVS